MKQKRNINVLLMCAIAPLFLTPTHLSVSAQTSPQDTSSILIEYRNLVQLNKAKNLARQAAEKANGGLGKYRAEPAMHSDPEQTNHQKIRENTWKFTFLGKRPHADNYTIKSVVIVDLNRDTVTIESNRSIP